MEDQTPRNTFRAKNKLVYALPFIAWFFDLVGGTASLKEAISQLPILGGFVENMSNFALIGTFAFCIIIADLLAGSSDYKISFFLGMIFISIIPIFTISEGYNEIQNNIILANADEEFNLFYANFATAMRYFGLSLLSWGTHYLLFKESKVILSGVGLLDLDGQTREDIEATERRKERERDNVKAMGNDRQKDKSKVS